jgi:hypothetical protein
MIAVFASAGLSEVVAERAAGSRRRFAPTLLGSGGACGTEDEPFGVQETTSGDGRFVGPGRVRLLRSGD